MSKSVNESVHKCMCEYILFNERTNEIVNESELKNEHENEKI